MARLISRYLTLQLGLVQGYCQHRNKGQVVSQNSQTNKT